MKKLYVDAVSLNGGGAFVLETGKQAELVYAGVTVYSMSPRERPDYDALEQANGLRFLFDDMVAPELPCYPVPQMDVFALDDGGWFASLGGFTGLDEPWPIVYLRRDAEAALEFVALPPPQCLDVVGLSEKLGGADGVGGENQ